MVQKYNDEFFIDKGFHRYEKTEFQNDGIDYNFQKRYDDEIGKKYFLDVAKWNWKEFHRSELPDYSYEISCQLYKKDDHKAVDIQFHSDWDLEEVEDFVEFLFQNGLEA